MAADRGGRPPVVRGLRASRQHGRARITAWKRWNLSLASGRIDELFFLIGADSLNDLPGLCEPGRIARLATIVVVNRPGIEEADPLALPSFGDGTHIRLIGHDPVDRNRLDGPPPASAGRPEHPLHGSARRGGLHRGSGALPVSSGKNTLNSVLYASPHSSRNSAALTLKNLRSASMCLIESRRLPARISETVESARPVPAATSA